MKSKNIMMLTALFLQLACDGGLSPQRPDKWKGSTSYSSSQAAGADQAKNPTQESSGDFNPLDPKSGNSSGTFPSITFKLLNPPSGKSDIYTYTLTLDIDASISHYAYKVDRPESCGSGIGYKVETTKTPLAVDVTAREDGPLAICLIAYHFPSKQWMRPAEAKKYVWEKIPFQRTIRGAIDQFVEFCGFNLKTDTEIVIDGKAASYRWTQDLRSQGCDAPGGEGRDELTITSSTEKELAGFWTSGGSETSGWFIFKWTDATRTSYTGTWGFGEPGRVAEGSWNSVLP